MKTNLFSPFKRNKYFFILPILFLILLTTSLEAQINQATQSYDGYVFCIITKDTDQEKLDLIQEALKLNGFDINYYDLAFEENGQIQSLRLQVETKDGYSGSVSMSPKNPIIYFYHLYNISKTPFYIGGGDLDEKIPGDIKNNLIARGGGYESVFNPKQDQNFSWDRIMDSDLIQETSPKGVFDPVILLDGEKITESAYLKMIREYFPMDELFIKREEAVERFGEKAKGGAILVTSK